MYLTTSRTQCSTSYNLILIYRTRMGKFKFQVQLAAFFGIIYYIMIVWHSLFLFLDEQFLKHNSDVDAKTYVALSAMCCH